MTARVVFLFQVRLIKEVSVSLMGNPNLMDPLHDTRSILLGCAFDVAEIDPEFILKVITNITIKPAVLGFTLIRFQGIKLAKIFHR